MRLMTLQAAQVKYRDLPNLLSKPTQRAVYLRPLTAFEASVALGRFSRETYLLAVTLSQGNPLNLLNSYDPLANSTQCCLMVFCVVHV